MTSSGLAERWYAAWNAKALDPIVSLYADDVEFASPLAAQFGAGESGVLRGKAALTAYFENALARAVDLKFNPIAECVGVRGSTLIYANHRKQLVSESHGLDAAGLIVRADVSYAPMPETLKA